MATDLHQPIIKKIKKTSGGGHHGGAWKVAYADFVTAMMAFFLLMWLLNATSEEQKRGISNYFGPVGLSDGSSGSGGVLGGLSISSDGAFQDSKTSPAITMLTPQSNAAPEETDTSQPFDPEQKMTADTNQNEQLANDTQGEQAKMTDNAEEEKQLSDTELKIKQMIEETPELSKFADNIIVDQTPEGLRIQIVDQKGRSMFPIGEAKMYDYTVKLLKSVAGAIKDLPNKISVTGHTDAKPYGNNTTYGNWELSTDRANSSRRILLSAGLDPNHISYVSGKAATDPLDKADPFSPQNRRITIVVLKKG